MYLHDILQLYSVFIHATRYRLAYHVPHARAVIVNWLTGKLIGCANFLGYRLLA